MKIALAPGLFGRESTENAALVSVTSWESVTKILQGGK